MELQQVAVELGERSYDIVIGPLAASAGRLAKFIAGRRTLLVADSHTAGLAAPAAAVLASAGAAVSTAVFPAGEAAKTFATVARLCGEAANAGCDRRSVFVAFGGGVTGDLTGFAAAVYMRGVDFIQVPTSLLAMVDSSVGGKTGVDLPEGKNLAGAFYQPKLVLIDPALLKTLPRRELTGALAEVVKYGVIADETFFAMLEANAARLASGVVDEELYGAIIRRSCEMKAAVVAGDERERDLGVRALLNYGHTFGHAAELLSEFRLSHGEAVAIGMTIAGELAVRLKRWTPAANARQKKLLEALGLPVRLPREIDAAAMLAAMSRDKKSRNGVPALVLPDRIGAASVLRGVDPALLAAAMEQCHD